MKKYIFLLIIVSFLAGCGSGGGGGSKPPVVDNSSGYSGGNKVNPECSGTGKIASIKVKEDGIYRVAFPDIYSVCSTISSIDISTISMSNQGKEIAIDVVDSNGNGSFDNGDYIEFYGKAIGRDDSRFSFSETNVYWLIVGEKTDNKRIEKIIPPVMPPFPISSLSFPRQLHMEDDTWYVQENYPEITSPSDVREHWFWGGRIYPTDKINHTFSTRYIDRTVPVFLKIRLQSVSLNHNTKVYVNNKLVSEKVWETQNPYDIEITIPPADTSIFYNSGFNNLTIESAGGGLFYLDWFEVNYNREFKAEHNMIEFTGKDFIKLSGFSSQDISLYEISDPANVQKINISEPKKTVAGDYEVSFSSPYDSEGMFMAITSDQKKSAVVESYIPSDITSKPADYIIITHEDFGDAIKALADYRALHGYNVLTVRVRDVYDEFSYGIENPHAIRDFLSYAYKNWSVRYVLLVGDATIDYKDLLENGSNYGVKNYVPAYLYNYPGLGEVPSDNWFADVDEANGVLPEMAIGRIPAKSKTDVTAVVNKIISHESSSANSNKILLVADTAKKEDGLPAPDNEQIFEILSDSIAELTPFPAYLQSKLYRRNYPGDLKDGLISAINDGQLIVNYSGHGSVTDWTNDNIFSSADIVNLSNSDYPFVVALNCMNGYFMLPNDGIVLDSVKQNPSISESFLLADGKGALAVWAASSIGYPSEHDPLAQSLYRLIFNENVTVLGDAVTEAKKRAYSNNDIMDDVVQTFIFFGDPATRLK